MMQFSIKQVELGSVLLIGIFVVGYKYYQWSSYSQELSLSGKDDNNVLEESSSSPFDVD